MSKVNFIIGLLASSSAFAGNHTFSSWTLIWKNATVQQKNICWLLYTVSCKVSGCINQPIANFAVKHESKNRTLTQSASKSGPLTTRSSSSRFRQLQSVLPAQSTAPSGSEAKADGESATLKRGFDRYVAKRTKHNTKFWLVGLRICWEDL